MDYLLKVALPTKEHYVYAYYTKDGPFYIGVGTGGRMLHHLCSAKNPFLKRKLRKLRLAGEQIGIKMLFQSNVRADANQTEIDYIAKYRKQGYKLCNIADGGDGGDTYKGKRLYVNQEDNSIKAFYSTQVPPGWKPGRGAYTGPKIVCYHPKTKSIVKVYAEAEIPRGFVKGLPKGLKTGPTGKIVVSNPKTGEHKWITPKEALPEGWVHGRSHKPSTAGKIACYDPRTGKMKFVASKRDIPVGWRLGSSVKNGAKPVKIEGKRYDSIADAMIKFKLSRYKLLRTYKVIFLEN